jgi:hypothetical protein
MDKFTNDFEYFWLLINEGKNFTFSRYADGEVMLMKGTEVTTSTQAYNVDRWNSPNKMTKVGIQLLETLNHTESDYYYAISGLNDNISDYNFLRKIIKHDEKNLTFVNLWINNNYENSIKKYLELNRDVIVICNEDAKKENFPFKIKEIVPFPNDCINFWENNSEVYVKDLIKKFGNMTNELFFISCGPISEIIIHELYNNNPNNTYVDVGSSIDEFVHNRKTRPYMYSNTIYSKLKSHF